MNLLPWSGSRTNTIKSGVWTPSVSHRYAHTHTRAFTQMHFSEVHTHLHFTHTHSLTGKCARGSPSFTPLLHSHLCCCRNLPKRVLPCLVCLTVHAVYWCYWCFLFVLFGGKKNAAFCRTGCNWDLDLCRVIAHNFLLQNPTITGSIWPFFFSPSLSLSLE